MKYTHTHTHTGYTIPSTDCNAFLKKQVSDAGVYTCESVSAASQYYEMLHALFTACMFGICCMASCMLLVKPHYVASNGGSECVPKQWTKIVNLGLNLQLLVNIFLMFLSLHEVCVFPVMQLSIPLTKVLDWTETSSQPPFSFLASVVP